MPQKLRTEVDRKKVVREGMKPTLTVALAQLEPAMADKEANLKKALKYVHDASAKKADLVVFPELFLTGYTCGEKSGLFYELSEPIPGPCTKALIRAAKKNDTYVIMGMPEANVEYPGLIHNSAALLGPEGVLGVFRKVHLPTFPPCNEIFYGFAPGDAIPVFEIKQKWKLGMLICYDTWFPEAARVVAVKGADLLVTISAGPHTLNGAMWDLINKIRAKENTMFHVYTNLVGKEWGDVSFFGGAMAYGPNGREIVMGPMNKEAMILVDLNAAELYKVRSKSPNIRDRRPSAYRDLTSLEYPHM